MMTLRCYRNSFYYLAADRQVASVPLCDGVLQREVNKRHLRKKMAKKDSTEKVKWEFNSPNCFRAGKVASWPHQKNINCVDQLFLILFCSILFTELPNSQLWYLLNQQDWKIFFVLDELKCIKQKKARQLSKGSCANIVKSRHEVEICWKRLLSWLVLSLFNQAALDTDTNLGMWLWVVEARLMNGTWRDLWNKLVRRWHLLH